MWAASGEQRVESREQEERVILSVAKDLLPEPLNNAWPESGRTQTSQISQKQQKNGNASFNGSLPLFRQWPRRRVGVVSGNQATRVNRAAARTPALRA